MDFEERILADPCEALQLKLLWGTALYDKGYHTGSELKRGTEPGIELMVAIACVGSFAPDAAYNFEKFIYNSCEDT